MFSATRNERKEWHYELHTKQAWIVFAILSIIFSPVFYISIHGANVVTGSNFSLWLTVPLTLLHALILSALFFAGFYLFTGILGLKNSVSSIRCQELHKPISDQLESEHVYNLSLESFRPIIENLLCLIEKFALQERKIIHWVLIEILVDTLSPQNNSAYSPQALALNSAAA